MQIYIRQAHTDEINFFFYLQALFFLHAGMILFSQFNRSIFIFYDQDENEHKQL